MKKGSSCRILGARGQAILPALMASPIGITTTGPKPSLTHGLCARGADTRAFELTYGSPGRPEPLEPPRTINIPPAVRMVVLRSETAPRAAAQGGKVAC